MKTCLYNVDFLKLHFYIIKLGFSGVYTIFFLFLLKHIDCGCSLEPPHQNFLSENFLFFMVKFSVYFNRPVFVQPTVRK